MKIHNNKKTILCTYILIAWAVLCSLIVCTYLNTEKADAAIGPIGPIPSGPTTATATDADYGIALLANTTQTGCITYGTVGVYFRQTPGGEQIKHNGTAIMLNGGHPLEILDTSNAAWYKVRLIYNGTAYTGYVASQYVYISSSPDISDAEFEQMISGFPESYKPQLRELHKKHPKWIFNPVNTGLDWNTVVSNEINTSKEVKNVVEGTSSYPRYNWRSTTVGFDYATDKYKAFDGSTWFAASDELVTYYLDPRVYLSERYIFAFETLTYDASQTKDGVEAILSGSFMYKTTPSGSSYSYSVLMVKAGAASGISPYHIASRIRQEVGSTSGVVTNGKHSTYPGIYNFYNIGAFDSSSGDAPTKALQWASQKNASYGRPWDTVYKSIYGGALYIGEKYIFKGQNTLYTQKFNVTNKSDGLYSHQYMTNVQAVSSEADKVYKAYAGASMLDNPIVFSIPVYNNMPSSISTLPADSGSPNNWLKTLTISGYSLNFNPATTSYSLSVKENVNNITIAATTVNSKATIAGTGTVSLLTGSNKIDIVVTAQNGSKRTYTLTVTRAGASGGNTTTSLSSATLTLSNTSYVYDGTAKKPSVTVKIGSKTLVNGTDYTVSYSNNTNVGTATVTVTGKGNYTGSISKTFTIVSKNTNSTPSFSGNYYTSNNTVTGVEPLTTINSFISNLNCTNGTVTITDASGKAKSSGNIATGDKVKIALSNTTVTYTVIIYGDVNGDGQINALDLLRVQKHLMNASTLSGVYLTAANVTKSGQVSALDLLRLQKHLMNSGKIEQ